MSLMMKKGLIKDEDDGNDDDGCRNQKGVKGVHALSFSQIFMLNAKLQLLELSFYVFDGAT